ncbi:unnamed protein product [Sphenostylis stenocarpa]|uniref:Uncharacterized protein n=1 Tax=Sphenostylis stenocarpa TaxID=92480 RepID=A0AA86SAL6_9FABA|nr:unnamed protein product [Sphenostylis stenocarpa]
MHQRRGADLRGQFGAPKRIEERIELMDDEPRVADLQRDANLGLVVSLLFVCDGLIKESAEEVTPLKGVPRDVSLT